MAIQKFIPLAALKEGMVFDAPLYNKKKECVLPQYHMIYKTYLLEWEIDRSEGVWTHGKPITKAEDYTPSLPGYMDIELRQLLQHYYDSLAILSVQYTNLKSLDLGQIQKVASFWATYVKNNNNAYMLLKIIRYSVPKAEYNYIHPLDVMLLSIGIYTKYDPSYTTVSLMQVAMGALLFDVGMFLLPEELLTANTLSPEQRRQIERHTVLGYQFLVDDLKVPNIFAISSLEHHERPDGSGYPRALQHDRLHPNSMIVALADMASSQIRLRSFKSSREPAEILKDFLDSTMPVFIDQFKQHISAFVAFVTVYPVTSIVELTTGEVAIVVQANEENSRRPVVMPILDAKQKPIVMGEILYLTEEANEHIMISKMYTKEMFDSLPNLEIPLCLGHDVVL